MIVKHLEEDLKKSNLNLETLLEEFSKLEEKNRALLDQKISIIEETAQSKARINFFRKEIDIRKTHLDDVMKSRSERLSDGKNDRYFKITNSISCINELITSINSKRDIGLENISDVLLYIIN